MSAAMLCGSLASLARDARAGDGGVDTGPPPFTYPPLGTGLNVGAISGGGDVLKWGSPVWVDSKKRVVTLPPPYEPPQCWDYSVTPATQLALVKKGAIQYGVAAIPGDDALRIVEVTGSGGMEIWKASCDGTRVLLASFASGFALPLTDTRFGIHGPIPMTSDDTMYWSQGDQLLKLQIGVDTAPVKLLSTPELNAALLKVTPPDLPETADPTKESWYFTATGTSPTGRIFGAVTWQAALYKGAGFYVRSWIVEIGKTGTLTPLYGPYRTAGVMLGRAGPQGMHYSSALDAMVLDTVQYPSSYDPYVVQPMLGIVPLGSARLPSAGTPPWPFLTPSNGSPSLFGHGFVPRADGGLYALTDSDRILELGVDEASADFDRDGLNGAAEASLGLSDLSADFDGDGALDGAEARYFKTDPKDPKSRPPAPKLGFRQLAVSLAPEEWTAGMVEVSPQLGVTTTGVLCNARGPRTYFAFPTEPAGVCFGEDGKPLNTQPYVESGAPILTPDRKYGFFNPIGEPPRRFELASGVDPPTGKPAAYAALSKDAIVAATATGGFQRIEDSAFDFYDPKRVGCPLVATPAELAACGAPELWKPALSAFAAIGYDPRFGGALLFVGATAQGVRSLIAVANDRIAVVADVSDVAEALLPNLVRALPGGGFLVNASGPDSTGKGTYLGSYLLGDDFQPQPTAMRAMHDVQGVGTLFKYGFPTLESEAFLFYPPAGAGDPGDHTASFRAEWIPVPDSVAKGEVIFWTSVLDYHKFYGSSTVARYPHGWPAPSPSWVFARMGKTGAVSSWLDANDFAAAIKDADSKASLAATPLGTPTAMASSPDALHICFVEPAAERVWELNLDPATREIHDVAMRVHSAGAAACAYSDANELAWVGSERPGIQAAIHVAGRTLPVSLKGPTEMLRIPNGWLVNGESPHCIGDDGLDGAIAGEWGAMSLAPGGVAYLDTSGVASMGRIEELCKGGQPREKLGGDSGGSVWFQMNTQFDSLGASAKHARMTVRPDGSIILSPIDVVARTFPFPLWRMRPTYEPLDEGARITEVDAFRRKVPFYGVASPLAGNVSAMTTLAGASASDDWGLMAPPAPYIPEPDAGPAADAGPADAGPAAGSAGSSGCGCTVGAGSAPASLVGALALVGAWAARRRSRRRGSRARGARGAE